METFEAINTRRSVRKFKNEPLDKEIIWKILEAANLAPTASNRQPWKFLVVGRKYLDKISNILDLSFKERVKEIGVEDYRKSLDSISLPEIDSDDKLKGLNTFYRTFGGAPVVIVVYVERSDDPWIFQNNICDASAAIENLILAAWSQGIGSCWMTGPLKKKSIEIQSFLDIQADQMIIGIVPLGIPDDLPKMPLKKDVKTLTKWLFGDS